MLYANLNRGAIITMVAFTGLVFGFSDASAIVQSKLVLWSLMIIVSLGRVVDGFYWRSKFSLKSSAKEGFVRFALGNILTGTIWSLYAVLIYQQMDLLELASTMVVLSAMAGGAATILAPSKALSSFYSTMLLVPLSILALIDPTQEYRVLGFLGVAFWLAMLSSTAQSTSFLLQVLSLKERNANLLSDMQRKQTEIEQANEALRQANIQLDDNNTNLEYEVNKRTEELFELSNRDVLTGLLNRTGLKSFLHTALAAANENNTTFAILFIDLDGFKKVNDALGHTIGDSVLETMAYRLKKFCKLPGLARWGGDEFILVVEDVTETDALALANSLRAKVSEPMRVQRNNIALDATMGIAMYPAHAEEAHSLIELADFAMYQQKRTQRGAVCVFRHETYQVVRQEESRLEGLSKAIDNRQLSVVYQPIVDANTHSLVSVEALLWWHFNGETISPVVFIPLAEKSGLINALGLWVLEQACIEVQQANINDTHALSVNVSVLQLLDDNFIADIDRVLTSTGFPAKRLHLEITESAFAEDRNAIAQIVAALKDRDIQISIDDFGTGFSSLSQLQLLSFDSIKIDKSFVMSMTSSNQAIVRATLMIAGEFGCRTIAEGVETLEQAHQLQHMGVSHLQGYHFAKPMSVSHLTDWLTQQEK